MPEFNPFDLKNFKELSRENLKNKIAISQDFSEVVFTMSLALCAAIKKVFFEKSEQKFSSEPIIERKSIVQFSNRMRIDAMEKFSATTFLSVVHYYKDTAAMQQEKPTGLIIIYIERTFVPEMLRLFKYPYIDYDNDDEVLDGIGALCNLMAGYFKKELARLGYVDLEMSHFRSAVNNVLDGIQYCKNQTDKYEIVFEINDKKRMVVEMVMDPLPKVNQDG